VHACFNLSLLHPYNRIKQAASIISGYSFHNFLRVPLPDKQVMAAVRMQPQQQRKFGRCMSAWLPASVA
jgi:hypothetical protein